jgi:GNAT superfamily N-acetyltransferase
VENPERPVGAIAVRAPAGVELRPVGRADLGVVVAMARELHGQPPATDLDTLHSRLDALVNDVDAVPMLATEGGDALGLAVLQFRRRLNFPTFEGWISDLFVRSEARRRGIGRALLDGLVAEWRLRGSHRLLAKAPSGADAAADLFAAAGMEQWMLDFRMEPIAPPAAAPPPADLVIRPLAATDGEVVTRLISEFGPARTPAPERMEAVLRAFTDHADRVMSGRAASTVAELDGEVVGVCTFEWQHPYWTADTHAWLPDLVVAERARRRGIGRALVADALARALAAGATRLSLESGPTRNEAHALYRSMGFDETGRTHVLRRTEAMT